MINLELLPLATIYCYSALYISVLSLWLPLKLKLPAWSITGIIACIFALINNQMDIYAVLPIVALACAVYFSGKNNIPSTGRIIAGITVIFIAIPLGAHLIPYFHNLKILSNVYISTDGIPFTMYLNFDKTIVGLCILGLTQHLISNKNTWLSMIKETIPPASVLIFISILLAILVGNVHFDPKLPECLWIWSITNLLFVCTAEEGFFRGFIQKNLAMIFANHQWGKPIALIITSLFYGLIHFSGGIIYVGLVVVAGIGYGWIYQKTNHIEASILTHFALNLIHILFFTYPALP
ncbi:MAG: hypothetical protein H6Q73_3308 [Firmicutes bacterium]|nr:hypothetical protein [Bacillota bacterium]